MSKLRTINLRRGKIEWKELNNNMSRSVGKDFRRHAAGKETEEEKGDLREKEETGGSRPFAVFLG